MTQITIRKLDKMTIDGVKKRASATGRSMEEEVRQILSDAVHGGQLARQRAWLKKMEAKRLELFGAIGFFRIQAASSAKCARNGRDKLKNGLCRSRALRRNERHRL
jgi:plasmid stability protein